LANTRAPSAHNGQKGTGSVSVIPQKSQIEGGSKRSLSWASLGWSRQKLDFTQLGGKAHKALWNALVAENERHRAGEEKHLPQNIPASKGYDASRLGSSDKSKVVEWDEVCRPVAVPWLFHEEKLAAEKFVEDLIRERIAAPCLSSQLQAHAIRGQAKEPDHPGMRPAPLFLEGVLVGSPPYPVSRDSPRQHLIALLSAMFWLFFYGPDGLGMFVAYAFPASDGFLAPAPARHLAHVPEHTALFSATTLEGLFYLITELWRAATRSGAVENPASVFSGRCAHATWLGRTYRGEAALSMLRCRWPATDGLDQEAVGSYVRALLVRCGASYSESFDSPAKPSSGTGSIELRNPIQLRSRISVEWDRACEALVERMRIWPWSFLLYKDCRDENSFLYFHRRTNDWTTSNREFLVWVRFSKRWEQAWKQLQKRFGLDVLSEEYRAKWPPAAPLPLSAVVKLWGVPSNFGPTPQVWWAVEDRLKYRVAACPVQLATSLGTVEAGSPEVLTDGRFAEELLRNQCFYRLWEWWATIAAAVRHGRRRRNQIRAIGLVSEDLPALTDWVDSINRKRAAPSVWFTYLVMPILFPLTRRPGSHDPLWRFYDSVVDDVPSSLRHFLLALVTSGTYRSIEALLGLGVVFDKQGEYLLLVVPEPLDITTKRLYRKAKTAIQKKSVTNFGRLVEAERIRTRSYLVMRNPSNGLYHVEAVPPEIRTVSAALTWRAADLADITGNWAPAVLS